jgi:hypothetical protein
MITFYSTGFFKKNPVAVLIVVTSLPAKLEDKHGVSNRKRNDIFL